MHNPELQTGRRFGPERQYEVLSVAAVTACHVVYCCRWVPQNILLALKVPQLSSDEAVAQKQLATFHRETTMTQRFSRDPTHATFYTVVVFPPVGSNDVLPGMLNGWIDGINLQQVCDAARRALKAPARPGDALPLLQPLWEAEAKRNDEGFVNLDPGLSNIMQQPDKTCVRIDFQGVVPIGAARTVALRSPCSAPEAADPTAPVDARTAVYAAAAEFMTLTTGRPHAEFATVVRLRPPSWVNRTEPESRLQPLIDVLVRATDPKPVNRYPNLWVFIRELRASLILIATEPLFFVEARTPTQEAFVPAPAPNPIAPTPVICPAPVPEEPSPDTAVQADPADLDADEPVVTPISSARHATTLFTATGLLAAAVLMGLMLRTTTHTTPTVVWTHPTGTLHGASVEEQLEALESIPHPAMPTPPAIPVVREVPTRHASAGKSARRHPSR